MRHNHPGEGNRRNKTCCHAVGALSLLHIMLLVTGTCFLGKSHSNSMHLHIDDKTILSNEHSFDKISTLEGLSKMCRRRGDKYWCSASSYELQEFPQSSVFAASIKTTSDVLATKPIDADASPNVIAGHLGKRWRAGKLYWGLNYSWSCWINVKPAGRSAKWSAVWIYINYGMVLS